MKAMISTMSLALSLALAAPAYAQDNAAATAAPAATPTAADADAFIAAVEKDLFDYTVEASQVNWVNATYITDDTDAMAARINAVGTEKSVKYALEAAKYMDVPGLSADTKRKLDILRTGLVLPAPTKPGAATELNTIATDLQSQYGKGRGTLDGKEISGSDIEAEMGNLQHTPAEFAEMWTSWHDNVAKTTERLWQEVKPLYMALHTYVRWKLNEKYGDAVQPKTGPIRADLLGNMWAQEWGNIYPLVAPPGSGDLGYDIGDLLKEKGKAPLDMVKAGENFYSSLGFAKLPDTFWKRSQFLKPADREVVCHASAWDIDNKDDIRIKMCIKVNSDDFVTIHHELGHNYYQRAYNKQPFLYLNGANDGFHEAIGDFIALSITPQYLVDIGLLDKAKVPSADKDIGLLLRQAMDKVAFLPFGLLVGSIKPADYNKAWTQLRLQYQGITPPVARPDTAFDPGAKYHIPGNTPYTRYFLARVLQFQFYQAACKQAGWKGPLHRCSFYGNK